MAQTVLVDVEQNWVVASLIRLWLGGSKYKRAIRPKTGIDTALPRTLYLPVHVPFSYLNDAT